MTDTNMLLKQTAGDTSGSDLLRVWSQQYGGEVALSLYETMTWLEQNGSWSALAAQYETPTTGQTVTVDGLNTWVLITPLATLATLTIALPNIDNAKHGDEVLISTTQTLVSLSITIANATAIFGAPTTLSAGASLRLKYNAGAFSWFAILG